MPQPHPPPHPFDVCRPPPPHRPRLLLDPPRVLPPKQRHLRSVPLAGSTRVETMQPPTSLLLMVVGALTVIVLTPLKAVGEDVTKEVVVEVLPVVAEAEAVAWAVGTLTLVVVVVVAVGTPEVQGAVPAAVAAGEPAPG